MSGSARKQERRYRGIPLSPGHGRALAHVIRYGLLVPAPRTLGPDEVDGEWATFQTALERTRAQLEVLRQSVDRAGKGTESGIFDAHLMMLDDRVVLGEVERAVREDRQAVDAAYYDVFRRYVTALSATDDPFLKERVADFQDLAQRVLRNLREEERSEGRSAPNHPHIVVAHDLSPGDTAAMDRSLVRGFVTETGSRTSHTAIIARALGIPAVVGPPGLSGELEAGDDLLIDGYIGLVVVNPRLETLKAYERLESGRRIAREKLMPLRDLPSETKDGKRIILSANIEFLREIEVLQEQGAEGVGLYRTEFFYLKDEALPTEEEQFEAYGEAVRRIGGEGVIFRTFDIGGDKLPLDRRLEPEPNPFLGWRGIRVSLEERDIFKTQIRAVLRASALGKARLMFPMISSRNEVREARGIVAECMHELECEGHAFDRNIEVGVMIEVPAAALAADILAPEVDFFSIGTNDLTQYALAVDRGNDHVSDLFDPMHPGVLRLMKATVDAARRAGIWVGVCGETAGDVRFTPILAGLGVDELSVGPRQLLQVKRAIRALDSSSCARLFDDLLAGLGTAEIRERCHAMAAANYPELLDESNEPG